MTEKTEWEKYQEKTRDVKPWDFLNPNTEYASDDLAESRYEICKACPELIQLTKTCKKCGCFMAVKTKMETSTCPIGKW